MEAVWSNTITTIINGIVTGTGDLVTFLAVFVLLIETYWILTRQRGPAPTLFDDEDA
jgi:hypothetical protein